MNNLTPEQLDELIEEVKQLRSEIKMIRASIDHSTKVFTPIEELQQEVNRLREENTELKRNVHWLETDRESIRKYGFFKTR